MESYIGIMHPDSHDHPPTCDCQALAKEVGVKWPELPWTCGSCSRTFSSHAMTLAVVNEKIIKGARDVVGKARKRLEKADKGELRLDAAERAKTKFLMGLAEEVLTHPASFACSPCVIKHQTQAAESASVVTELLVEILGIKGPASDAPPPVDKSVS